MFERFTEKARRVIFFARYEASVYGSPYIESEHLLLGIVREDRPLVRRLGQALTQSDLRAEIEKHIKTRERISTSIEIPLTEECKSILNLAAADATRFQQHWIGPGHLLLALLRFERSLAAKLLVARGVTFQLVEQELANQPDVRFATATRFSGRTALEEFLAGFQSLNAEQLLQKFASEAVFVDASGQRWNYDEIRTSFDSLFVQYAKRNASYVVEPPPLADNNVSFVGTVLWKNALLASEERVWLHRMSVVLLPQGGLWKVLLLSVTVVRASEFPAKWAQE
jgi:hypothetical protein